MGISRRTIDLVLATADVTEVVGDFVQLKRRGTNMIACCPFHNEKTPSFYVSPAKGIYKCFGCGKGGDSITFVMEIENLTYPEAIRWLAKRYNITVEETGYEPEQGKEQQQEKESLLILLNQAKDFYKQQLLETEEGKAIGDSYFKERAINAKSIADFELGYAPDAWDAFMKHATSQGWREELLEKAGLIIVNEGKKYDRFRNRVIFPIHAHTGKVLGFGARILTKDKNQPKYINSPETEVYNKSKVLYGLFQARNAIRQTDNCYLTEGYTDVIAMHQAGIANVVASSGTSLTKEHIKLIGRYTKNLTLLYDGDQAGIKASLRGIDMILEEGLNVRAVVFPDGDDPDSFLKRVGTIAFEKHLAEAVTDFISFKANLFAQEAAKDPIKKGELVQQVLASVALVPDVLMRDVFIKQAASIFDMDQAMLLAEVNKLIYAKQYQEGEKSLWQDAPEPLQPVEIPSEDGFTSFEKPVPVASAIQELEFVRMLVRYGQIETGNNQVLAHQMLEELEDIAFEHPVASEILQQFRTHLGLGRFPDLQQLQQHEDEQVRNLLATFLIDKYEVSPNWISKPRNIEVPKEEEVLHLKITSVIMKIKMQYVRKQIELIEQQLDNEQDEEKMRGILKEYIELKEIEKLIAHELGIVVNL
jgi:DNA primase